MVHLHIKNIPSKTRSQFTQIFIVKHQIFTSMRLLNKPLSNILVTIEDWGVVQCVVDVTGIDCPQILLGVMIATVCRSLT